MEKSENSDVKPQVREVESVRTEAKDLSSQILDAISLKGRVSEPGPGVSRCDEDPEHLYKIHHAWSLWGVPESDMERSMDRLKAELPKRGWKVASYGRDKSLAKNLELVADSINFKFSVDITFMDKRRSSEYDAPHASKESGIMVNLESACFSVPDGKTVEGY
ncbi:hypothetical protein ACH427_06640 [Streptomyces sp. NPDC020379]|uniref:hypothetical protein n=1 Tax=Streptomyces sp. NPDC020379 TaxID=3365071 RepID=UPI0037BBE1EA